MNDEEFIIEGIGSFKYHSWPNDFFWMGQFEIVASCPRIDLRITVKKDELPTQVQIENVTELLFSFSQLENIIFNAIKKCYSISESPMKVELLKTMYFISSIDLKNEQKEFWIVLEPFPTIELKYDQLLRFTLEDMKITWSNLC